MRPGLVAGNLSPLHIQSMRTSLLGGWFSAVIVFPFALSRSVAQSPAPRDLTGLLPTNGAAEQVVVLEPGQRTIYLTRGGELSTLDHKSSAVARLLAGRIWDVAVSAKGDLLAYVKGGEARTDHFIYVQSLNASSGQPAGAERRLTAVQGDAPAISPDGRFVAFARDDTNGVGQSLLVVPTVGGKERVLASAMPASIRAISWTPDGRTIYFGVNPPVPCVPEWSCLPLGESRRQWGSIRRVPANGGEVAIVVPRAQSASPGLSPDGSTIVYRDVEGLRRWVIADADGAPRTTITLSQTQMVQGWSGAATLIVGDGGFGRGLRSLYSFDVGRRP
jgi:hypothetical protein